MQVLLQILAISSSFVCVCVYIYNVSLVWFYAVYDITIGYKNRCPSFLDNAFGVDPAEVHIHIERIAIDDIPLDEIQAASWLIERFSHKDQLLSKFHAEGHFLPHHDDDDEEGIEGDLSTIKCLANCVFVILLTIACTFFTFFSSIWFKVYVSSVCAYLVSATYFNFRPQPILPL